MKNIKKICSKLICIIIIFGIISESSLFLENVYAGEYAGHGYMMIPLHGLEDCNGLKVGDTVLLNQFKNKYEFFECEAALYDGPYIDSVSVEQLENWLPNRKFSNIIIDNTGEQDKIINYKTNKVLSYETCIYAGDLSDEDYNGEVSLVYTGNMAGSWYELKSNDVDFYLKDGEDGGYEYAGTWYDNDVTDEETITMHAYAYELKLLKQSSKSVTLTEVDMADAFNRYIYAGTDAEGNITNIYKFCSVDFYDYFFTEDIEDGNIHLSDVSDFRVMKNDFTSVNVTWDKVSTAIGYDLFVKENGIWKKVDETSSNEYTFSGLSVGKNYEFAVKPYNYIDDIRITSKDYASLSTYTTSLSKVSNLKIVSQGTTSINVSWSKVNGATGYTVYMKKNGEWGKVANTTSTNYTYGQLLSGTKYELAVKPYVIVGSETIYVDEYVSIEAFTKEIKSIASASTTLSKNAYTYNGLECIPNVTVKLGTVTLKDGVDYTKTYSNNKYPGIATVTITGKGDYTGTIKKTFNIYVPNLAATSKVLVELYGYDDVKVSWKKVSGATGYYVYYKASSDKSYKKLGSTTALSYKKANLADGKKYAFRIYPYVKINGKVHTDSSYKTSSSITTLKKISTPSVKKSSKNKVKVTWKNIGGETGYQISRSTNKKKTSIVSTYKTTSGKSKVVKVTRNKTYYYKVRAYKTVGSKKIYGPWSSVKAYRVK